MADATDSAEALAVAREAAAEAVAVLRGAWTSTGRGQAEEKRPHDLVTEADREAERRAVERIRRAFPEHAVVAEESGGRAAPSEYRWYVDPLDGTANYVHHFPVFGVSIALYRGEEPLVGVVVDPVRDEWFTARAGAGARVDSGDARDGTPLAVSTTPLGEALLATGFPFRYPEQLDRYLAAFRALFVQVSDMRRAGAAALDLAWVAAGRVEGFWELGLHAWDVAAGELLVREAGGQVSDWTGGSAQRESGWIVAASPAVHGALVDTLAEFAA